MTSLQQQSIKPYMQGLSKFRILCDYAGHIPLKLVLPVTQINQSLPSLFLPDISYPLFSVSFLCIPPSLQRQWFSQSVLLIQGNKDSEMSLVSQT